MKGRVIAAAAGACALLAVTACTVHQTEAPPLTGPSEFGLSVRLSAYPDAIKQDGFDASTITIEARGPDGRPMSAVPFRVDTFVNGAAMDIGALSERTVVTNADGVARVVFTAPPEDPTNPSVTCAGMPGQCVEIYATPTGTDFVAAIPHSVTLRLIPMGQIRPPAGTPFADFVVSPLPATMNLPLTFDATASTPGLNATQITNYSWTFGDGGTGSGPIVTHAFTSAAGFVVTLTVTNDRGLSASKTQTITVDAATLPDAVIDVSPSTIRVGQTAFFSALQSTAAPGRTLVRYSWNFGDGTPAGSGPTTTHVYTAANTYTVTLTVSDDLGAQKSTTVTVVISP